MSRSSPTSSPPPPARPPRRRPSAWRPTWPAARRCRDDFARYRAIDTAVGALRSTAPPAGDAEAARQRLIARLADLQDAHRELSRRSRRRWARSSSPAPSTAWRSSSTSGATASPPRGCSGWPASSRGRTAPSSSRLQRELLEYLERPPHAPGLAARSARGAQRLPARGAGGDRRGALRRGDLVHRHRRASWASRRRSARWPRRCATIRCPSWCRAIASWAAGGDLVGYAGDRVGLKEQLLAVEGVPTLPARMPKIARGALYHYEPNPDA